MQPLDDHAFDDAHHPALSGQVALARAILDALRERGAIGWHDGPAPATIIDPAETTARFSRDTEKWVVVRARSATSSRDFRWARDDRTERLAQQRPYEDAGQKIAQGHSPRRPASPASASGRPRGNGDPPRLPPDPVPGTRLRIDPQPLSREGRRSHEAGNRRACAESRGDDVVPEFKT